MDIKIGKKKYFSLKFSLSSSFTIIVILTSMLSGTITYFNVRSFIREGIKERLKESVSLAAMHIDGDLHKSLTRREDETSEAYKKIKKHLQQMRNKLKDIRYVYTVRKNEKGQIYFVVDAEEKEENLAHINDIYDESSAEMNQAFEKPYDIYVENEFSTDKWGTFLSSYAPVFTKDGRLEAVLGMDITANKIIQYELYYLLIIFSVCCVISIIVIFVGMYISHKISHPLKLLEKDMANIQKFDLESDTKINSIIAEVVNMKTAVDNMKSGLRSFKKYVPADIVAELIKLRKEAVLSGEKREVSMFFSDIAGFTGISEKISPELLAEKLGIYFEGMASAIIRNKGTLDKFIGDAIMAFWGAPLTIDNHALLACNAALQCQRYLDSISEEWLKSGIATFETRIGIHTGETIVGNIGYNERLSYTIIGDNVNLASRLEGLNKYYGTKIIISEFTHAHVCNSMTTRLIDIVAVKGRSAGVRIYELISEKDNIEKELLKKISRFNEGTNLFYLRKWNDALKIFNDLLQQDPKDSLSLIYYNRCQKFIKEPPTDDWNGITIMDCK